MERRRLSIIFIIVFANYLSATLVLPILPLYAGQGFGAAPEVVTLLGASYFAAQLIAGPFLGRLSDKHGRVPVLLFSQVGTVISFLMLPLAPSLAFLFAARILDGITGGNVIVAQAYITDVTPRDERVRALGLVHMAFGLGYIIGPALGGLLAQLGDQATFYGGALIALVALLLTWFFLDESLTADERLTRSEQQHPLRLADVFQIQPLLLVLGIAFAAQFCLSMLQQTFSLFGEAVIFRGQPPEDIRLGVGLLLTAIGGGQFITQVFIIQRLVHRFSERALILIGALLRAGGLLTLTVFTSPWLIGGLSLMGFAVGSGLMMPSLQSLATKSVSDDQRGSVLGFYNSSVSLGIIIGSAISGLLFAQHPTLPFLLGGLILLVLLLPASRLPRQR